MCQYITHTCRGVLTDSTKPRHLVRIQWVTFARIQNDIGSMRLRQRVLSVWQQDLSGRGEKGLREGKDRVGDHIIGEIE